MKILVHTDDHFKYRGSMSTNDSKGLGTRLSSLVKSYEYMYSVARSEGVSAIVNCGDLLDKAVILPEEGKALYEAFSLNISNIPEYILVGNHDRKSYESHGLSVLDEYPNVKVLDEPSVVEIVNGLEVSFLPYDNKYDDISKIDKLSTSNSKVLFSHVDMIGTDFNGIKSTSGYDPKYLSTKFKRVYNGHIHSRGTYQGTSVVNIGALQGSGFGDNYSKGLPGFLIIEFDNNLNIINERYYDNKYAILYRTIKANIVSDIAAMIKDYDNSDNYYYLRIITNDNSKVDIRTYLSTNPSSKLLSTRVVSKLSRKITSEDHNYEEVELDSTKSVLDLLKDYIKTVPDDQLPSQRSTINKFIDREFTI